MTIDLTKIAGFGVAGNFTDHLEQAGESADFTNVKVDDADAPKGIFPFYLPTHPSFLGTFPLSATQQRLSGDEKVQMEPEVALLCELSYKDGVVSAIRPTHATAYNDCSIRRPKAKKISEKKNWGSDSKGYSEDFIVIDHFSEGGILDHYRIASFVKRAGEVIAYGQDSELLGYSYFYQKLIDWMIKKFQIQEDQGPLEVLRRELQSIGNPAQALISIGATRYTDFGETHFLEPGDELFVVLYNQNYESAKSVVEHLNKGTQMHTSSSILHQKVSQ